MLQCVRILRASRHQVQLIRRAQPRLFVSSRPSAIVEPSREAEAETGSAQGDSTALAFQEKKRILQTSSLDDLPDELKLPAAPAPIKRALVSRSDHRRRMSLTSYKQAGVIDLGFAALGTAAASGCIWATTSNVDLAEAAGFAAGTLWWVLRDCTFEEQNRSIGKRIMGIYLAKWNGASDSRIIIVCQVISLSHLQGVALVNWTLSRATCRMLCYPFQAFHPC